MVANGMKATGWQTRASRRLFTVRIFGLGMPELVIIVVIIVVLCGPVLFKKLGGRTKKVAKAAKAGLESGATNAGVDVEKAKAANEGKSALEKLGDLQDKLDEKLDDKKELDIEA